MKETVESFWWKFLDAQASEKVLCVALQPIMEKKLLISGKREEAVENRLKLHAECNSSATEKRIFRHCNFHYQPRRVFVPPWNLLSPACLSYDSLLSRLASDTFEKKDAQSPIFLLAKNFCQFTNQFRILMSFRSRCFYLAMKQRLKDHIATYKANTSWLIQITHSAMTSRDSLIKEFPWIFHI